MEDAPRALCVIPGRERISEIRLANTKQGEKNQRTVRKNNRLDEQKPYPDMTWDSLYKKSISTFHDPGRGGGGAGILMEIVNLLNYIIKKRSRTDDINSLTSNRKTRRSHK